MCRTYLLVASSILIILAGCRVKVEEEPVKVTVINPKYLELVSLRGKPDATHTTPVRELDGPLWYREAQPGLDLSHFVLDKAYVQRGLEGKWAVVLWVADAYGARISEWSRKRIGHPAGFVVDGELLCVYTIQTELRDALMINAFETPDEARNAVEAIKAGGFSPAPAGELQLDASQPDVPCVFIHRFPRCVAAGEKTVSGPVVAVWQDGRIVRVAPEATVGEGYVEGRLTERHLSRLIKMIERSKRLMRGNGGMVPVGAAAELLCVRSTTKVTQLAEVVPRPEQTEMAKLKEFLLSADISEPKEVARPWRALPEGWRE